MLERDGLLQDKYKDTAPIRVDYSLTPTRLRSRKNGISIERLGRENIEQVIYAQQRFDAIQEQ